MYDNEKAVRDVPSGLDLSKMKIIKPDDDAYPTMLKYIKDEPKQLYCIGDISLLKTNCVAVVGTRHATSYGKWAASAVAKRLCDCGITVVSGMAAGIDSFAHQAALSCGGKTIAVLGCGLNYCFPRTNTNLVKEIAEKGLVISELSPELHATKFTFPLRNRIISGLSTSTVIVEAALKSGSLITAELAAEQGRNVYAIPGNINNIYSLGCNKLIRDGATAISVVDDVVDGYFGKEKAKLEINLSDDEEKILNLVLKYGELSLDSIASMLCCDSGKLLGLITLLEMKGLIHMEFGKVFSAI